MEKESLRRMLELTYELEGLLDMAINRDEVSDLLFDLIDKKLTSIRSIPLQSPAETEPAPESAPEIPDQETPEEPWEPELEERQEQEILKEEMEEEMEEQPELPEMTEIPEISVENIRQEAGGKHVSTFSINDRFLFSRELFGGNIAGFEQALKEVAALDSYEEAEEFFYTEYGFDQDNPTVADFMIRISKYFE